MERKGDERSGMGCKGREREERDGSRKEWKMGSHSTNAASIAIQNKFR